MDTKQLQKFIQFLRKCGNYTCWRLTVLDRDKHQCILCGSCNELQADHYPMGFSGLVLKYKIKTLKEANSCEELWDEKNGRTLCKSCHSVFTKYLAKTERSLNRIYRLK